MPSGRAYGSELIISVLFQSKKSYNLSRRTIGDDIRERNFYS
jgi:hypothetical protein